MNKIFCLLFQIYTWLIIMPLSWFFTALFAFLTMSFSYIISPRWASKWLAPWWGRLILFISLSPIKRKGLINIDKNQSYIIVCNHQSLYDIMAIYGYLPLEIKWVMKQELAKMPFVGVACKALGHIFVDRSDSDKARKSLINAKDKISGGVCAFFFPEGTRSKNGELALFKTGGFRMAKELDLPILPVTISGANKVMAANSLIICPHVIEMTIHEPISAEEVRESSVRALSTRAKNLIASKL